MGKQQSSAPTAHVWPEHYEGTPVLAQAVVSLRQIAGICELKADGGRPLCDHDFCMSLRAQQQSALA